MQALRGAGRGSAQDLAGMRYEHLRVLVEEEESWSLFCEFAHDFDRAQTPADVMQALRLGRMTALRKKEDEVRGIVAGSLIRQLVCKTVAKQFGEDSQNRTAPFQFALQTKAGTDALVHALRYITDQGEDAVITSLDGIGAFDHVKRSAFFTKLYECEELRPLLPLVTALYGTTSRFLWTDDSGQQHQLEQEEGGEQGCPLMPALYALAQHDALVAANGGLTPDDRNFAFLGDVCIVTTAARVADVSPRLRNMSKDIVGSVDIWEN